MESAVVACQWEQLENEDSNLRRNHYVVILDFGRNRRVPSVDRYHFLERIVEDCRRMVVVEVEAVVDRGYLDFE